MFGAALAIPAPEASAAMDVAPIKKLLRLAKLIPILPFCNEALFTRATTSVQ
jgi:hypothetical protein